MPKAILKFTLPEEKEAYAITMKAGAYYSALYDLYNFLRADSKYGEGKYEEVYTKFFEILNENEVEIP